MLEPNVARALLEKTVGAFGVKHVAERLGSPPDLVRAWLDGVATMPERKCAVLLDLMGEIGQ